MKEIQTVGIVGLGALGVIFAHQLTQGAGYENVKVLADAGRTARYKKEGVFLNGERCAFHYVDAAAENEPLDLLLFAVKFGALETSIAECRHLVGPDTTIISALNGIASEQILSDTFGTEKIVWCVAQKMSAVKEGNRASCPIFGELALGASYFAIQAVIRRPWYSNADTADCRFRVRPETPCWAPCGRSSRWPTPKACRCLSRTWQSGTPSFRLSPAAGSRPCGRMGKHIGKARWNCSPEPSAVLPQGTALPFR